MEDKETQYKNFLKDNPNSNIPFNEWEKINARLIKQALVNMMKDDKDLGLYDETECYCGHTTTCDCGPEESYMDFTGELDGLPNLSDIIKEKYPEQETLEEAADKDADALLKQKEQ